MQFRYSQDIRTRFPQLCSRVILVRSIGPFADPASEISRLTRIADHRLAHTSEGELPEVRAWRRAFSAMGLKPTQYRCASEALLRRYRKDGALPPLHPLIDLCNAASLASAIPVAVFDAAKISGSMTVRPAIGDEIYATFGGENENPDPGEIIFVDDIGRAHARRWTNRQSGWSAIRHDTAQALIVVEALHETASADAAALIATLGETLTAFWTGAVVTEIGTQ